MISSFLNKTNMKKILILLTILYFNGIQAQITVAKLDGTPILNNDVINFNSISDPQASLDFHVFNNSSANIKVKIECVSLTNADGTGMELCFGNVCLSSVSAGESYPNNPVTIAPNSSNGLFDHFYNTNAGNGQYPADYVFRFYQIDALGNEIGNSITLTYRYTSTLSTTNFNSLNSIGVSIESNFIEKELEITTVNNIEMNLYNMNGKEIRKQTLNSGNHTVDASSLSSGTYIINFKTDEGQIRTSKFIKK